MSSISHSPNEDILYFLHIPKTAGTSLITILDSYFQREHVLRLHAWKYLLPKMPMDFSKFRFVRGHYGMGFYRLLPKKPLYLTVLRDPKDIIISSYKMIQRQPEEAKRYSIPQNKTISELILDPKIEGLIDTQTHWLAVDLDVMELSKDMDMNELASYQPEEHTYFKHPNISEEQLLQTAKNNLSEFAWIGTLEKFEESLFLLHYKFGWKPIRNVVKKNVAPAHKKSDNLTDKARRKIDEWTKLDKEVYRYGTELFESRYSKMVDELKEKYYESGYEKMEHNDMVFDMLQKHYKENFVESPKLSFKDKVKRILAS